MTGRFVALIVLALLAITASSQCCNEPPKDYCPKQSFNIEGACSIFGRGHVHTFDGSRYDFHEYGDFIMFGRRDGYAGTSGTVHVRMAECTSKISQSVPTDKSGKYSSGTCVRSVVVKGTSSGSWEVKHSMNSPTLDVYRNQNKQPVENYYSDGDLDLFVTPMTFVDPYASTWRDKQSTLTDADFFVTFSLSRVEVTVMFYSSGETTVLVEGRPGFGNTGGLCGFADNCAANDLALREDTPFNPPEGALATVRDARILTTVSQNTEPYIYAGDLNSGDQFINTTEKPQNWAGLFANSWRIPQSDSRFSDDGRNYNIRWYSSTYDTPKGSCNLGLPAFMDQACVYDSSKSMDKDGWETLSSRHLMLMYCLPYCVDGAFTSKLPELQAHHCNGICQYAEGSDITIDEPFNRLNLPPLSFVNNVDLPTLSLSSPLNLAGSYLVNMETHDFCGARSQNLTLKLKCDSSISVRTPRLPAARIYRNAAYGWPTVLVIGADISKSVARVSWTWISVPNNQPPHLAFATSTSPSFTPDYPGNYTLQYTLYDGCQIRRQLFTFVAECAICDLTPMIAADAPLMSIWEMEFMNLNTGPILGDGRAAFYPVPVSSETPSDTPPYWAETWSHFTLKGDNFTAKPLERVELTDDDSAEVMRYPSLVARDFAIAFPNGQLTTVPVSTTTSTSTSPGPSFSSFTLPRLVGPTGTQFGVAPPQREVDIKRTFWLTHEVVSEENVTVVDSVLTVAQKRSLCSVEWNTPTTDTQYRFTPNPLDALEDFTRGSLCVGQYVAGLKLEEEGCPASEEDTSVMDLSCGPNPEILLSCTGSSEFDFDDEEFTLVTIDASASYDSYQRSNNVYDWRFLSVPAGSGLISSDLCGPEYRCPSSDVNFRPDVQGTYKVQFQFSNLCGVSTVETEIVAHCTPQTLVSDFTSAPTVSPFGAVLNQVLTPTNPSGSRSTWSLTTTVTPFFFQNVAFFSDPADWDTALVVPLPGVYKVTHSVDICGQMRNTTKDVTLTCSNALTATFKINNSATFPFTVNFNVNSRTWPTVSLDSTASVGAQQSMWYVGTDDVDTGVVVTFDPAPFFVDLATPLVIDLYTMNACDAKKATGSIKFACPAITANIAASSNNVLSGDPITLTTSGSIPSASIATYTFYANDTILFGSGPTVVTSFTESGVYVIRVDIFNGCGTKSSASISVTVRCPNTLTANPVAVYPSDPSETVWRQNSFGLVRLGGTGTAEYTSFVWKVISAPALSIYNVDPFMNTVVSDDPTISISDATDDFLINTQRMTRRVTTNTVMKTIILDQGPSSSLNMSSCIQPDVEGTYLLELMVSDVCQKSKKQIAVVAKCGAAPMASVHVAEANNQTFLTKGAGWNNNNLVYMASLDRSTPRRVILDASASTSSTSSRLQFYWSWATPDARYNTENAQDDIDNAWGSVATISLDHVGNYSLTLTIHDGCKITQVPILITATCGTSPKLPLRFEGALTATVKGATPEGTTIYTFRVTETSQKDCAYKNSWTLLDYTEGGAYPVAVSATSAGVSFVPSFLLISLFVFFARF